MPLRTLRYLLPLGAAILGWPSKAHACSCGGVMSSAAAVTYADVVFVGTVTSAEQASAPSRIGPDGSVGVGMPGPLVATFDVARVYRGRADRQVTIRGSGTSCEVSFAQGEVWLVYASVRDGKVATNKCTRTRVQARASSDLTYLEGLEAQRPQGIVHGYVLRRIARGDGQPALQSLFEPLRVVAVSDGRRTELTTDPGGAYQLVLPPGEYDVWVERSGRPVAPKQSVQVVANADRRLHLTVDVRD